jgi:CPA1 family monovalent cation:H+ antiporter
MRHRHAGDCIARLCTSTETPFRDLIVLTAFAVVLGTLVIQGLTLRPLIQALDLHDDDPVGQEAGVARERALRAALRTVDGDHSPAAEAVRQDYVDRLSHASAAPEDEEAQSAEHHEIHWRALHAARRVVLEMRANDEIGDDAFHQLEEEFDWIEMSIGSREDKS